LQHRVFVTRRHPQRLDQPRQRQQDRLRDEHLAVVRWNWPGPTSRTSTQ
jgi:hypothetical protein